MIEYNFLRMYRYSFLCGLCLAVLFIGCQGGQETHRATYRPLVEAVYASGFLTPGDAYQVYPMVEGYVVNRMVKEGDSVEVGSPLFEIESDQAGARLATARRQYQQAMENAGKTSPVLLELEATLQNLRVQFANDSVNYLRYQNLRSQEVSSLQQYERARLAYEQSRNQVQAQQARLQRTRADMQTALKNAESQYLIAQNEQGHYVIRSQMAGMVYELYKEQGEAVRRGEPVAMVGSPSGMYLRLSVDEQDIGLVKRGQEVLVKVDMEAGKIYKARIQTVYPMLNKLDQSFRVDAVFTEGHPQFFSGVNLEANILIRKSENALSIPRSWLIPPDTVLVLQERKAVKVRVTKGLENLEFVEIVAGANAETQFIKP
jgi:multidrug resistance efflux pump